MAFCYILPKIVVVFASQPDFESIQGYNKPKKGEFLGNLEHLISSNIKIDIFFRIFDISSWGAYRVRANCVTPIYNLFSILEHFDLCCICIIYIYI